MKKGINIWSFPADSLKNTFALAKDAGFEGVEVALDATGEITLDSTEKDLLAVKKTAENCGIELYSMSCGLCWAYILNDDDAALRTKAKDIIKKQLAAAAALGCESILALPGVVQSPFVDPNKVIDYETTYNRSLEALQELKEEAEKYQVEIALENVWNKFLLSPMEFRDFIDKVGSDYVGSYFDVGNALLNGYPEQWIKILGSRIKKVHFKDFRLPVGTLDGFVDLLAGDVNYPAVMDALNAIGYDGWVSAEMIPNYKHYPATLIYNTSNTMDVILGRK